MPERLKQLKKPLLCLLGAALFLVCCLFVMYRILPQDVYLAASPNNDEVSYNRQVAGVLRYGMPQGVFGYDETRAEIGRFGAWGPVIIYLYALPALLVGGGYNTLFWGNLLFALAGWLCFALAARLGWRRQLLFAAALFFTTTPLMFVFSGSVETFFHALLLAVIGLCCAGLRRQSKAVFGALCLLCALGGVLRPYALTFWLYPLVVSLVHKNRRQTALCVAGGGVSLLLAYLNIYPLSAPYYAGALPSTASFAVIQKNAAGIGELMRSGAERNFIYLFVLFALTLAAFVWDIKHKRPAVLKGCILLISLLVFASLLLLYQPTQTGRHCLLLTVGLLATLLLEDGKALAATLPVLALLFVLSGGIHTPYVTPGYDAALDAELNTLHTALEESLAARSSDDVWDNTLAFSTYEPLRHNYLYALPDGMGIQFDQASSLSTTFMPIHSRYVMVGRDSIAIPRLLADGFAVLVQTDGCVIYERID